MRITGHIPQHIARAYGVTPNGAGASAGFVGRTGPANPAGPVAPSPQTGQANAITDVQRTQQIDRLVGGTVQMPIAFDGASTPLPPGSTLQLYNRAADRIEAATGIEVGRAIDLTG